MFIGHYAISIALSSTLREKGALTFISVSSVMPDLFMLATASTNSAFNYHADWGFLICIAVSVFVGFVFKFERRVLAFALAAMLLHLPLDYPYSAQDSTNLYAHPRIDFLIEESLLLGASTIYILKQKLKGRRLTYFLVSVAIIGLFQGLWNFVF